MFFEILKVVFFVCDSFHTFIFKLKSVYMK